MENFIDLRIIKTKQTLVDACFDLLKQQLHSKLNIRINEVCQKAKINPITFYHHFNGREDLLLFTIKEKLINILPIPINLKPKSLHALIRYLINNLIKFTYQRLSVFSNSLELCKKKGNKETYFEVFKQVIKYLIYQEIQNLTIKINIIQK